MQSHFLRKRGDPSDNVKRQIISLGCGYDTFVFSLMENKEQWCNFGYFELDLAEVVINKVFFNSHQVHFIEKSSQLREALKCPQLTKKAPDFLLGNNYGLASCDLTDLSGLEKQLKALGVDFSLPTLIFTECVLAYIDQQSIEKYLSWAAKHFDCLALLDYDMVNPNDPFGKMMVHNFKQRGIPLIGMDFFESLPKVKQSYESQGLSVEIATMRDMYYKHLDQQERARIEKLEFLDELEEFWLVQEHYFMSLAKSSQGGIKAGNELNFKVIEGVSLFSLNNK